MTQMTQMNNQIKVSYDQKTKRLVLNSPFHLVDVARGFPSRRFDPKSKTWRIPLLKSNVIHFDKIRHRYDFVLDDHAREAIRRH